MKAIEKYDYYLEEAYTCDRCGTPFIPEDDIDGGYEDGHAYITYRSAKCPCCNREFDNAFMCRFTEDDSIADINAFAECEYVELTFEIDTDDDGIITADTIEELQVKMENLGYYEPCLCIDDVRQDKENDNRLIVAVY